jgi:hypothetical protein
MRRCWFTLILVLAPAAGCRKPDREIRPIPDDVSGQVRRHDIMELYDTQAFVYREGRPEDPARIYLNTDKNIPAVIDDANLVIFAEGSGDQARHFARTCELIAQSRYHPDSSNPNLLFVLVHWSESDNVVKEHLNFEGQRHGSEMMRRMCKIHQQRNGSDGFVGIIGFSAGTRVTQLAFGAVLPEGHPGDKPPTLTGIPEEMKPVDTVVYLGSSLNRDDPLPFGEVRKRFINFVNNRDTHYGDQAPYYAPAGTSPIYLRVVEANLFLARPRTGASANGFSSIATFTDEEQFLTMQLDPRIDKAFRMVNVDVPPQLIPWSYLSTPILDDNLDTYWNLAPNHYSMVGRGPEGKLYTKTFRQYEDLSYEFVREQVASAVLQGIVYEFDLKSEPKPNILPSLISPANLILRAERGSGPRHTPEDDRESERPPPPAQDPGNPSH